MSHIFPALTDNKAAASRL